MDAEGIGRTIAKLRRKNGFTQAELAEKLHLSDKTVSKWESGAGYPGITQLPELARIFGVSVDYILSAKMRGITVAGSMLVDLVKTVDCYPQRGMLAGISEVSRAVGGCAPNTAIDLARIDSTMHISALGMVGDDDHGRYIINQFARYGIDTRGIKVNSRSQTGFSDVMSISEGERTIFHCRGANSEFSPRDIALDILSCRILHIGYLLLLDEFDKPDPQYGTVMARFLHDVQQRGIKTSVDAVSNSTGNFAQVVLPALKYCDYVIVNEIESCLIWNILPRDSEGRLIPQNIQRAMQGMIDAGVRDKVIVHSKEQSFCMTGRGEFVSVPSLKIPSGEIKGSVGAGDAFCAGCLYGIYNDMGIKEMLEFASGAAASSLFADNSVDGVRSRDEIEHMLRQYPKQK